ncbi:MAG TPA: LptF/LptG family permease [Gemmatimonadota bacterium]|nr:LptF/LptG family permease [Gemmatimonadota bacterium]
MLYLRRLDRYLMGQFLVILAIALAALSAITILVHLMDHIDVYLDAEAAWSDVGRHYLYQLPYNLLITLPMAMLIATILTIGEMGRHGELTAMKASGLSLYRIAAPVLVFSLGMSFAALLLNETVVPRLNEQANDIYDGRILGRDVDFENFRGSFVYQNSDGYTYIVRSLFVQDSASSGEQVEIQRAFDDGTFLRINAPRMTWEPATRTWVLTDGELRLFPGAAGIRARRAPAADTEAGTPTEETAASGGTTGAASAGTAPADSAAPRRPVEERMFAFQILHSPHLDDTPQELLAREKDPEEIGYRDLQQYIADRERLGAETRKEQVDLQMKVSYPFANVIIVLFGVALVGSAVHTGGGRSASAGFGLALFLTIIFWGFLRVGQGVGYGGGLSPVAAAWLGNIVFLVMGLGLLTRAKT